MKDYLITGGAGFIGANFVKYILKKYKDINIVVLDKLTYAGDLGTIKEDLKDSRVTFIKGDVCNRRLVENIFKNYNIDYVVNFAAESHVDRSIEDPEVFLHTNILGTQVLMGAAKTKWSIGRDEKGYPIYKKGKKFLQISTDEVYGSLEIEIPEGGELKAETKEMKVILQNRKEMPKIFGKKLFTEETPMDPRSPYAVSKASADMLVKAYIETYKFPANITRCSNNYGPYQFPEKLIPLIVKNILEGKEVPVYGDGKQVRDWLYVDDHCKGIDMVINKGKLSEIYNIGGLNEEQNINIVKLTIDILTKLMKEEPKYLKFLKTDLVNINYSLIIHVQDRLGHDVRYAIDPSKTAKELGFYPEVTFASGIEKSVRWYLENQKWVEEIVSGDYQKYYDRIYRNN